MVPLRQRLLLVVGWVVAAVGIGLVSATAVAVAGGQVRDRPLRPLSAAEVAALPVTTEDECAPVGPLASGGSDGTCPVTSSSNAGGLFTDDSAQPTERETPPEGAQAPGGTATPPANPINGSDAPADEVPDTTVAPTTPAIEPTVVELTGGQVRVTLSDGSLVLTGATPRPGFVADILFRRTTELTVTFWNGTHLSTVVARVVGDSIAISPSESAS